MWLRIKRIIKTSIINFFRSGWLSLTATLIMMLALIIVGVFATINLSTNKIVAELKNKIDIVVNFKDTASDAQIQKFKSELLGRPNITSVEYISKEDALAEFKSRSSVKREIRDLVSSEDNPLPRGLRIQSVDVQEFDFVSTLAKSATYSSYIDSSSYDDNKDLIARINSLGDFVKKFGLGLAIFFILVAALVVANTVRLAVMFRAKEIEIMRLVGASESFVKIPFLIEGFLYGLFALVLSMLIIYFGLGLVLKFTQGTQFFSFMNRFAPIYYGEFWYISLIQFVVGSAVGVVSSWLSINRSVKL